MYSLETLKENYLIHCKTQKELNAKTIKAYHIDLKQFIKFASTYEDPISKECLTSYLAMLHEQYQPKTTKRKIASLKAFFHFLEYQETSSKNNSGQHHSVVFTYYLPTPSTSYNTFSKKICTSGYCSD